MSMGETDSDWVRMITNKWKKGGKWGKWGKRGNIGEGKSGRTGKKGRKWDLTTIVGIHFVGLCHFLFTAVLCFGYIGWSGHGYFVIATIGG